MNEIGKFIRKTRKERGLRLEDLSDEHISTATISNIERGVPHVNKEKIFYLMGKLGLDIDEIPQMIEKDSENMESIQLKFATIESLIQVGNHQRGLALLSKMSEDSLSRHQATVHLLKGRCYIESRDWRRAERELSEAIRLAYQDPFAAKTNLEAVSYNSLAQCRYRQNDWEQALKFVEQGLDVFQEASNSFDQIQYTLMINRVIYLEKLGRTDEAFKSLEELWNHMSSIQNKKVVLNMYALKADLFRRMKLHHDAVRYAKEGIFLAVASNMGAEMFKLWTILGTVFIELDHLEDAETCFEFILDLKSQVNDQEDLVRAYCSLGHLYLLQGQLVKSKEMLIVAAEIAQKIHEPTQLHQAYLLLGQVMKKMNQLEEAIQLIQQAVQIAEKHQLKKQAFIGYYELAHCYELAGKTEEFKQATEKMYQTQRTIQHRGKLLPF